MASKLMLAAQAFVCFVAATNALKCYHCTYRSVDGEEKEKDCKDAPPSDMLTECASTDTYCYKSTGESEDSSGRKIKSVIRMCGAGTCTEAGSMALTSDIDGEASCCEGDSCNSAGAIVPTIGVLLASLLLTKAF